MLNVLLKTRSSLGCVPAKPVLQPSPLAVVLVLRREGAPAALPRSFPLRLQGDQAQAHYTTHSLRGSVCNHDLLAVTPPVVILSTIGS